MPTDDKPAPSLTDEARAAAARKVAEAAVTGALDAVERFLFGKVGGAEEAVKKDAALSALDRLRAEAGEGTPAAPAAPPVPKEDPVEVAKRQLEELKRQMAAPPVERKKTM